MCIYSFVYTTKTPKHQRARAYIFNRILLYKWQLLNQCFTVALCKNEMLNDFFCLLSVWIFHQDIKVFSNKKHHHIFQTMRLPQMPLSRGNQVQRAIFCIFKNCKSNFLLSWLNHFEKDEPHFFCISFFLLKQQIVATKSLRRAMLHSKGLKMIKRGSRLKKLHSAEIPLSCCYCYNMGLPNFW